MEMRVVLEMEIVIIVSVGLSAGCFVVATVKAFQALAEILSPEPEPEVVKVKA